MCFLSIVNRAVLLLILFRPPMLDFFKIVLCFYFSNNPALTTDLSYLFLARSIRFTCFLLFCFFSFFLSFIRISEWGHSWCSPISIANFSWRYRLKDDLNPFIFLLCYLIEFDWGTFRLLFSLVLSDFTEGKASSKIFISSYRLK